MLAEQKQRITELFQAALQPLLADSGLTPSVTLERPRDPSHGDVACNIAMQIAKPLKKNPRELAQAIVEGLMAQPGRAGLIDAAEIAGPGFINLRIAAAAKQLPRTMISPSSPSGSSASVIASRMRISTGKTISPSVSAPMTACAASRMPKVAVIISVEP